MYAFQQIFHSGENKLQHLPADFGNLVHLEELDLSGSELVCIFLSLLLVVLH